MRFLRRPRPASTRPPSAFRDLVAGLGLRPRRILDVGAGGFAGETTTVHLLDIYPRASLVAVELNAERADALRQKFEGDLDVRCEDVRRHTPESPYDLVVLDLDTAAIPMSFEEIIDGRLGDLLAPGGVVVTMYMTDILEAYAGPRALPAGNAPTLAAFHERYFGRLRLDDRLLQRRFDGSSGVRMLAAANKFGDDPHGFIGWLALEHTPATTASPVVAEPAPPVAAAPPSPGWELDLVGDTGRCGPACPGLIEQWSAWARTAFDGVDPAPGGLVVPRTPMALIDVPADPAGYEAHIGAKSRNMLRKVERLGYDFRAFEHDDHLDDLFAIHTSKATRSGGEMTSAYRARPRPIGPEAGLCDQHRKLYLGAFHDGVLWGYGQLVVMNDLAIVNRFMGHGDRLRDGIMNGVARAMVDLGREAPGFVALNYLTLRSSTEELDRFKRSVGFRDAQPALRLSGTA